MTKKVSMHVTFYFLTNQEVEQILDHDGFNVKVVTAKQGGKWVKFKDKADATMFKLQHESMENYVEKSELTPSTTMYDYQKQMMGRAMRAGQLNVVMAGRRTGKTHMQNIYHGFDNDDS